MVSKHCKASLQVKIFQILTDLVEQNVSDEVGSLSFAFSSVLVIFVEAPSSSASEKDAEAAAADDLPFGR